MKKNFLSGALLLVFAGVLSKLIGAFYRIPLGNMIGAEGMAYYQAAYPVYALLLVLSTSGLPTAVSRLVSERIAKGEADAAKKLFLVALFLLFVLGTLFCAVLFVFAPKISQISSFPTNKYSFAFKLQCFINILKNIRFGFLIPQSEKIIIASKKT